MGGTTASTAALLSRVSIIVVNKNEYNCLKLWCLYVVKVFMPISQIFCVPLDGATTEYRTLYCRFADFQRTFFCGFF